MQINSGNAQRRAADVSLRFVHASLIKETVVRSELDVFDARRNIFDHALEIGFSREQAHYVVTMITELGNNIVFHAEHGRVCIERVLASSRSGVAQSIVKGLRITAQDKGPGITDISRAMQEGFSTRDSLGCGLSGVERLADELHIESNNDGAKVTAILWQECPDDK